MQPLRLQSRRRSPSPSPPGIEPRPKTKPKLIPRPPSEPPRKVRQSQSSRDVVVRSFSDSSSEGVFETPGQVRDREEREKFLAKRQRLREEAKGKKLAKGSVRLIQLRNRERSCSSCYDRKKTSTKTALQWFRRRKEKILEAQKQLETQKQRAAPQHQQPTSRAVITVSLSASRSRPREESPQFEPRPKQSVRRGLSRPPPSLFEDPRRRNGDS